MTSTKCLRVAVQSTAIRGEGGSLGLNIKRFSLEYNSHPRRVSSALDETVSRPFEVNYIVGFPKT